MKLTVALKEDRTTPGYLMALVTERGTPNPVYKAELPNVEKDLFIYGKPPGKKWGENKNKNGYNMKVHPKKQIRILT